MIGMKIVAIVAAVAVVGGAATAIIFWPSDDGRGGWYAWDPTVGEIEYSKISATPKIVGVMEDMYRIAYGELPEKMSVPVGEEIEFDPLVEHLSGGEIRINGSLKTSTSPIRPIPVTFTDDEIKNMRIISYGLGFTDSYEAMLGENVWDTVVAAGNSTWNNYPGNGMTGGSLGSEMTISFDALNSFLNSWDDDGETFCLVVWGYISNYDALLDALPKNVKILCIDYYAMTSLAYPESLGYLLSVVDALGQLIGIDTEDNDVISDIQDRLFTMKDSIPEKGVTAYMETSSGTSPGTNTLTQLCFDVLGLTNINTTSGTYTLSDEVVVTSAPKVIFFDVNDPRTMDQKMRVTV